MMKRLFFALTLSFLAGQSLAQKYSLEKIWETDTVVAVPESVLPDYSKGFMFVSLVDGQPAEADGKGGVGKLSLGGKIVNMEWITGLNAPKGLGRYKNRLYVADLTEVVIIDINKGKIEKKIPVNGAVGLNDITVDNAGIVYVSDSKKGKVHIIKDDAAALYLDNLGGVNGLKSIGDELYMLAGKSFIKADANRKITNITTLDVGGDGLEPVGNGDFIVTAWTGYIWYVYANGEKELLMDTHLQKKNTADISFDQKKGILYLPTFFGKTVAAYKLKSR